MFLVGFWVFACVSLYFYWARVARVKIIFIRASFESNVLRGIWFFWIKFDFSEFNLIFLGLIIQELMFLLGFLGVCLPFPVFLLSSGCSGQKYITSGYLQFSKKWLGSVRVFKNTRTAGQISGRVWTRPSPTYIRSRYVCDVRNDIPQRLLCTKMISCISSTIT